MRAIFLQKNDTLQQLARTVAWDEERTPGFNINPLEFVPQPNLLRYFKINNPAPVQDQLVSLRYPRSLLNIELVLQECQLLHVLLHYTQHGLW